MKCKQHYTDLSSIVGVCASCLRERLFPLIAAQSQSHSDTHPAFPRSVSPYITRRKSDHSVNSTASVPDLRFFSTPQVGPTAGSYNYNKYNNNNSYKKKQHSFIRFSLLTKLFRSKKRKEYSEPDPDPTVSVSVSNSREFATSAMYSPAWSDPRVSVSVSNSREIATSAMYSPAWFTNIRSGTNRKKQSVAGGDVMRKLYCPDHGMSPARYSDCGGEAGGDVMRELYCPDHGMSPARYSDCGGAEDKLYDGYSGYESSELRKQTPWRTPAHPSVRLGAAGSVSGLNFRLSPLVRASPCRLWNQKEIPVAEVRAPVKPHLPNTKSFCANRSRKLADFGRFDNNR